MWIIFIILVVNNNRKIRNEGGSERSKTHENKTQINYARVYVCILKIQLFNR